MKNISSEENVHDPITELFHIAAGLRFVSKALENEWEISQKDFTEGAACVVQEIAVRVTDIATRLWDEEYHPVQKPFAEK